MKLTLLLALLHLAAPQYTTDTDFLATFGYLDFGGSQDGAQDSGLLVNIPEDVKSGAVREFQRYYGLKETGVVDAATAAAMRDPRCGVKDKESPDEKVGEQVGKKKRRRKKKKGSKSRAKRFVTSNTKWRNNKLSYRFQNYTSDIPTHLSRSAFHDAFSLWEEFSALQFYEETNGQIEADITISYLPGRHTDGHPFNSLVLAHAFFPRNGALHMNDQQSWNYHSPRGTDTVFVAVHELGHVLGLRHSKRHTIMHASYPGYQSKLQLSRDDIRGIQSLYGPNPCYPNNPCQNGGSCRKHPLGGKGFVCSCPAGWKGSRCDGKIAAGGDVIKCRGINLQDGYSLPKGRIGPNEVVTVYCNPGFELVGARQFQCTFRGFYTPATINTSCRRKVTCPAVTLTHGTAYPAQEVGVETVVSFGCDDGYQLAGSLRVKCRQDGTYDRSSPTCEKIVEEVEVEEVEEEEEERCPESFDTITPRTAQDSLMYGFKGDKVWIYRRGSTASPQAHWSKYALLSEVFPNIPLHLDASFPFTDPESGSRYIVFVKWPEAYYWDIKTREIFQVRDFRLMFKIPSGQQITAAYRWDDDTIYFFVPYGYYIYKVRSGEFSPPNFQPMSNFSPQLGATQTVTAAVKSFYEGYFYLFVGDQVYLVRKSDLQVSANFPYDVSTIWWYGLRDCRRGSS